MYLFIGYIKGSATIRASVNRDNLLKCLIQGQNKLQLKWRGNRFFHCWIMDPTEGEQQSLALCVIERTIKPNCQSQSCTKTQQQQQKPRRST